jgi:hypothetical protein
MTGKMRWDKAALRARERTDWRREADHQSRDPAARWLAAAESRRHQRRQWQHSPARTREPRPSPIVTSVSTDWITAPSSAEVPW